MLWECFSEAVTGRIVRVEGKMIRGKYSEILDENPPATWTFPIQPDRAWKDLQLRMGETLQIQVCKACSVKTQGCNRCQRCVNKVLSKGSKYSCKCDISFYKIYTFLLCHNGVFCVDWWGKQTIESVLEKGCNNVLKTEHFLNAPYVCIVATCHLANHLVLRR